MELLVLNYHYFREVKYKNGIYPISEDEFIKQVEYLDSHYKIISQEELREIVKSKKNYNDKFSLLTFDDGLKEQMKAFEILKNKGLSGVFYVITDAIENNICIDVHKIHHIRSLLNDLKLYDKLDKSFNISGFNFNFNQLKSQYKYDNLLSQKVKYFLNFILDSNDKHSFINELFTIYVDDESDFSKKLYMNIEDLKKLSTSGMLGSHSASHSPLSQMSDDLIKNNIHRSLNFFQNIGISNIPSISYPYGGRSAVDERVAKISNDCGFEFGITMFRGVNSFEYISQNKMLLKRISCSDLQIEMDKK
tara:strand:- start:640 stop:1557 length:918 start_codon:yes stop_codon:yes gene_type:complete